MIGYISRDEWYPVYEFYVPDEGGNVEIPDEKLEWVDRVTKEFWDTQEYLREIWIEYNK